jgi:hypothetical protein
MHQQTNMKENNAATLKFALFGHEAVQYFIINWLAVAFSLLFVS